MERQIPYSFVLIVLPIGFSLSKDQMFVSMDASSQTFSNQHLVFRNDQQMDGDVKKNLSFKPSPPSQVIYSEFSQKENSERELWKAFSQNHQSPLNVSVNGSLCILFWAKRITIQFKDQTQLDLTDKTFGNQATVDVRESNCSEENATLSLKFGDVDNLKGLDIRFSLARYNKLPVQSWFSLQRIQILYNNSIQATFNATRIYAPSSYSFHCERVSSLQKYDPLLIPSSTNDISRLWEVTFIDFQIQAFRIKEGQFASTRDCASFFSPAILMGLATSLLLLLVLAYALHMLIHLKSLDRHYECKASPAYFSPFKDLTRAEEKEPLRTYGSEYYELQSQQFGQLYI
ncbi:V-type proton ATPase subunit S1-like protein isoform X2 [Tachyglossus aculeatus]|uniref:V-type proton ATPase subunit S1-like protein isoform X2 n=1 Tax=Tachyglossus aculeatus TaxID=9261 RepID=UPI0018F3FFD3|nr:V-type proton ATPase subunit S1-like protein isoform X2 [Tachyglossus aculeatus]